MTASSPSINFSNVSTTTFRAWGSAFNTALAAVGFVQTSDTGQINWTTVTVPSSGALGGYEIWRFNDSLQSTAPIYFKLEYRTGGGSQVPDMKIYVGTGSDGAGNLTGTANGLTGAVMTTSQPVMPVGTTSISSPTAQTCHFNSADGSGLMVAHLNFSPASSTQWGFMLVLERTRAWDGSATGDGVICMTTYTGAGSGGNGEGTFSTRFISFLVGFPTTMVNTSLTSPLAPGTYQTNSGLTFTTTILSGSTVNPIPYLTGLGPKVGGPSQLIMGIAPGDYPAYFSVTMSHYGVSRTWRTSGIGNRAGAQGGWGSGAHAGLGGFMVRVD